MAAATALFDGKDEVIRLLLEKTREAEQSRTEETTAAVTIQRHWRGHIVRDSLEKLRSAAIMIQSCYRMYRGQLYAESVRQLRDRSTREKYFHLAAVEIQRHWRGYRSRQLVHDYYARKRYIEKVMQRTNELRLASVELAGAILRQQEEQQRAVQQEQYDNRLISLHHLLSTKSMPGVLDGISIGTANSGTELAFESATTGDNSSIEEMIKTLKVKRSHRHMKQSIRSS